MDKCPCPIYCKFCGAKLKKDYVGHYCPSRNCQWQYGCQECNLYKKVKDYFND